MFGLPTEIYVCNDCQAEWIGDGEKSCCECGSENIKHKKRRGIRKSVLKMV